MITAPYIGSFQVTSIQEPARTLNGVTKAHNGIDLVGSDKTIYSTVSGTVIRVGWQDANNHSAGWGYHVRVQESTTGNIYIFAHMAENSSTLVKDQPIQRGMRIGTEGGTGYSFGNHLHYEIHNSSGTPLSNTLISGIPNVLGRYTSDLSSSGVGSGKIQALLSVAESHVGEGIRWVTDVTGFYGEWCCAFVIACAMTVGGLIGEVFHKTYSCTEFARQGVEKGYGTWLKGPYQNEYPQPQIGDLFFLKYNPGGGTYDSGHIGFVKEVTNDSIVTIHGNWGSSKDVSKVVKTSFSLTSKQINGYFRPDWAKVGDGIGFFNMFSGLPIYAAQSKKEDAVIREVGYITANGTAVTKQGRDTVKLSVINYTGALCSLFSMFGMSSAGQSMITDGLDPKPRACVDHLISKGLSAAAAVGIAANIQHESSFNPASAGDRGYTNSAGKFISDKNYPPTSFGICQWHYERGEQMKKYVGADWAADLSGQLDFLYYDMTVYQINDRRMKGMYDAIVSAPNNEQGARACADQFVRHYERPANVDDESETRQNTASQLWSKLVPQLTPAAQGGFSAVPLSSGIPGFSNGEYVDIPSGLGTIMTYMGAHRLTSKSSKQYQLIDNAKQKGRYSIANPEYYARIDGRDLVATKLNIGGIFPVSVGEYIDVTYLHNNGQQSVHKCIIGDIKGADAASPWGHQDGKCVCEMIYNSYSPPSGYNNPVNNPWAKYSNNGQGRIIRISRAGYSGLV